MKLRYRIHEWVADRVSWVQYPHIRPADSTTREASRTGYRFKTQMQLGKRIDLAMMSLITLLFSLFIAGVVLFLAWALLFE